MRSNTKKDNSNIKRALPKKKSAKLLSSKSDLQDKRKLRTSEGIATVSEDGSEAPYSYELVRDTFEPLDSSSSSSKYAVVDTPPDNKEVYTQSSITISVTSERDFGVYQCFANNSVSSTAVKFYIYGGGKSKTHAFKALQVTY